MHPLQKGWHRTNQLTAHGLADRFLNVYTLLEPGTYLPPDDEAAILMFNHDNPVQSFLTPGFLTDWPLQMWAKEELWQNPFLGAYLTSVGMIRVKGASTPKAFEVSRKVLAKNGKIGIFGEGTRTDGKAIYKQRTGGIRLALETGTNIYVFAIVGSSTLKLKDRSTYHTPIAYKLMRVIKVERVDKPTFEQIDALARQVAAAQCEGTGLPYVDEYYKKRVVLL